MVLALELDSPVQAEVNSCFRMSFVSGFKWEKNLSSTSVNEPSSSGREVLGAPEIGKRVHIV